jgi:hypothetical protein
MRNQPSASLRRTTPLIHEVKWTNYIFPLLIAALFAFPDLAQAQPTAHYVPGVEGLKGATLPPPGLYLRDYSVAYYSTRLNDAQGHEIRAANPEALIYANVPRVIWITDQQLLGGNLGLDALLPLQYTDLRANTPNGVFNESTFGLGDVLLEGLWSRHLKRFDMALGYAFWAPSGDSAPALTTRAGHGYWTHMLTAGVTYYIDADKKWAVSALNRYEFNQRKENTKVTPGQAYTLEWGISRNLVKIVDLGLAGYYQQKVTEDSGSGSSAQRDRVAGIGPEVSGFIPSMMLGLSIRYAYEFMAENRLQGQGITLTVTKRF